jgi:hypothetical protein
MIAPDYIVKHLPAVLRHKPQMITHSIPFAFIAVQRLVHNPLNVFKGFWTLPDHLCLRWCYSWDQEADSLSVILEPPASGRPSSARAANRSLIIYIRRRQPRDNLVRFYAPREARSQKMGSFLQKRRARNHGALGNP